MVMLGTDTDDHRQGTDALALGKAWEEWEASGGEKIDGDAADTMNSSLPTGERSPLAYGGRQNCLPQIGHSRMAHTANLELRVLCRTSYASNGFPEMLL